MLIFFDLTGNKTPEATKSSSSLRNRSRKKILARVTLVLWFKRITDYQKNYYLSLSQTVETFMDCQHGVTLDDAQSHRCTHGSVHTSTGGADIHNGHIDVTLPATDGHNETAEGPLI